MFNPNSSYNKDFIVYLFDDLLKVSSILLKWNKLPDEVMAEKPNFSTIQRWILEDEIRLYSDGCMELSQF